MLVSEKAKVRQGAGLGGVVRGRGGNRKGAGKGGKKEAGRKRGVWM